MMKKIIIVLLFLTCSLVQAQYISGKIIYGEKINKEFLRKIKISKKNKRQTLRLLKKQKKQVKFLEYTLSFNQNKSVFHYPETMPNDNGMDLKMLRMASGANGVFYNDLTSNIKLRQKDAFGTKWIIKEKIDTLNWEIGNETRIIKGYRCIKATTVINLNRRVRGEVTAWFCPDLPFQLGPLGFSGLPGMILGLKRHFYYFYAKEINLSKKPLQIKKPKDGKLVTQEEYFEEIKEL